MGKDNDWDGEQKKLVICFDIDTHKCIRDGVPNLLRLADEENTKFTFFLNGGRSISFVESIKELISSKVETAEVANHMSAMKKLGIKDYIYAALFNPKLTRYKAQIHMLMDSQCEVGLHGGKNHALWAKYASGYGKEQVLDELKSAIEKIRKVDNRFKPIGFASPDWNTPNHLADVLNQLGFKYYRDNHGKDIDKISSEESIPQLFVNLLGEPGGVAFFENKRAEGMSDEQIIADVMKAIRMHNCTVLYDHPYYAGLHEIDTLRKIIRTAKREGISIVTLGELVR